MRATCQPPSLPAAALRQLWVANRVPASATTAATSATTPASSPDSWAARGLIEHTSTVDEGEDARRQYYRLTPAGNEVATAEARRLAELVRRANVDLVVPVPETR